jgi:serine acetyltransferase
MMTLSPMRVGPSSFAPAPISTLLPIRGADLSSTRRKPSRRTVLRKSILFRHRFWSAITGADIPLNCNIGGGLLIPHPNGIVIHPDARI